MYTFTYICAHTYTRIRAHTYMYACTCTLAHRQKISATMPQHVKKYNRHTYVSIYICMHIHIYIHIHTCAPLQQVCLKQFVCWYQRNVCITYTPAHALVPRILVLKCMQHSLQKKNTHMYTNTHMRTHTYAHEYTCAFMTQLKHAEEQLLRRTIYAQIRIHIHIHMYIHAYVYTCIRILIHIHMHLYIYTHVRALTYIHVYTHTHTTCTYARTQARLEWQRCSDSVRSLTWPHENSALLLSKWYCRLC